MQSRFSYGHYQYGMASAYKPGGVLNSPDLSSTPIIPAPEYYFLTEDYMNSSGGDFQNYTEFDFILYGYFYKGYDRFAKSTSILPKGNIGFWSTISAAQESVMMMKGDAPQSSPPFADGQILPHRNWWTSKGLGVYKNVAYGYSGSLAAYGPDTVSLKPPTWIQSESIWPMSFPVSWTPTTTVVHTQPVPGNDTLIAVKVFPLTSAYSSVNPDLGLYIVTLAVKPWPTLNGYWGIWEIVPEHMYPDSAGLIELWSKILTNLESTGNQSPWHEDYYPVWIDMDSSSLTNYVGGVDYISLVSGEKISFALGYGASPWESGVGLGGRNVVRRINDSAILAYQFHGDISSPNSLPLIEVRQVDSNYNYTEVYYVSGDNAGKITINNPHLEWKIELDASDWWNPKREESINKYVIHENASTSNPGEFSTWDEAYASVKAKMALLETYDEGPVKFIYVSPGKEPVLPTTDDFKAFPLDGAGSVPFTLEGRTTFPE